MVDTVGRKLQRARLARKLEIEDVARATKIRPGRIIDLEADAYAQFPSPTYANIFLATYAKFLGVDIQKELENFRVGGTISLDKYQYQRSATIPEFLPVESMAKPKGFRVAPLVAAALVLVMLVSVPVLSYLALNIPRLGGANQSAGEEATAAASPTPSASSATAANSSQFLAQSSPTDAKPEASAQASPEMKNRNEQAAPAPSSSGTRTEEGIELRTALPVKKLLNSAPTETQPKLNQPPLPEKQLEIRVLKRTWVEVMRDQKGTQPVFEGFVSPGGHPIVVAGKRFWVRVSHKGAVEVRENGRLVFESSEDVVIN